MQATLVVERIERRLSLDPISDAEWLRTRMDTSGGRLRIVESMRYSDDDIQTYGAAQIRAWVAEDHQRYDAFQRGEWWFVDAFATAIIGVYLGEERVGQTRYCSSLVGGLESDAPRDWLDDMTEPLVAEVREGLAGGGFTGLEGVETPYVLSEPWIAPAI